MECEISKVRNLFAKLCQEPKHLFPELERKLQVSKEHGVYVLYRNDDVVHVGRTLRGKEGLNQRLKNHLYGSSSFVKNFLKDKALLRGEEFQYQYILVESPRDRALLESYAIGSLCPEHLGLSE